MWPFGWDECEKSQYSADGDRRRQMRTAAPKTLLWYQLRYSGSCLDLLKNSSSVVSVRAGYTLAGIIDFMRPVACGTLGYWSRTGCGEITLSNQTLVRMRGRDPPSRCTGWRDYNWGPLHIVSSFLENIPLTLRKSHQDAEFCRKIAWCTSLFKQC